METTINPKVATNPALPSFRMEVAPGSVRAAGTTEKPTVKFTVSSNKGDLYGTAMSEAALNKIVLTAPGMLFFLNHDWSVPEGVFGQVLSAAIRRGVSPDDAGSLYVDFEIEVTTRNPRALLTYQYLIEDSLRLGASLGFCILEIDYQPDANGNYQILDLEYLEGSVVGVPANRQSWAQTNSVDWLETAALAVRSFQAAQVVTTAATTTITNEALMTTDNTETTEQPIQTDAAQDPASTPVTTSRAADDMTPSERVQAMHDHCRSMGAACQSAEGDGDDARAALLDTIEKRLAQIETELTQTRQDRDNALKAAEVACQLAESLRAGRLV